MRFLKKIIALICIIAISLSCLVSPASAIDVGGIGDFVGGVADFGQWAVDTGIYAIKLVSRIFDEDICPERPGGVNATHSFVVNTTTKDGVLADWYVCEYCGFNSGYKADSEGFSAAYDDYVETLPAPGYNSSGHILLQLSFYSKGYLSVYIRGASSGNGHSVPYTSNASNYFLETNSLNSGKELTYYYRRTAALVSLTQPYYVDASFVFPISGLYRMIGSKCCDYTYMCSDGISRKFSTYYPESSDFLYREKDSLWSGGRADYMYPSDFSSLEYSVFSAHLFGPTFEVIPDTAISSDTYNITTRPTSISGGNYGIIGDNGQITTVEDNSTIINETNNTYYNPATGTTVPIINWSYDYSDRSYKVTLESGDTATITYGDENITIQEGDTVYNIYYLIDGSGSEDSPCEHDWQEGEAVAPTCTLPGKASYVCSKCQQTKTESIPALGHNWQVKQTVTTQYDDTGQLVQEGYTIFECSLCHEQYKSTDGTAPPGGSGTDPGGDEEGEGFLSWLLGKIGELLGTIGNGILNLLQTALDKIFGGLIDLVNSLFENLAKLVDLFGSVGDAFGVLWTWLPPEIMAILVAGVSIFVFIALIKFFMK